MNCPACGDKTKVVETKVHEGSVYRRRRCTARDCRERVMTREMRCTNNRWPQSLIDKNVERLNRHKEEANGHQK